MGFGVQGARFKVQGGEKVENIEGVECTEMTSSPPWRG